MGRLLFDSILDFLICRRFQQLGVLQELTKKLDRLGIIVPVGKALVDGKAQVQHLVHFICTVCFEDRAQGLFADDAEHRARAPVRQVMVAAVELDRAKV